MTNYHVNVLYDTRIGMGCSNNVAQMQTPWERKVCINLTAAIVNTVYSNIQWPRCIFRLLGCQKEIVIM